MLRCLATARSGVRSHSAEAPSASDSRNVVSLKRLTPLQQSLPALQAPPDAARSILMNILKGLPYA